MPGHLIQRDNNRHICFGALEDYSTYVGWLNEYSKKYAVDIHAWVMMINYVHLLCTPQEDEVEVLTGRRLKAKKVGRPIDWRKKSGI